jgi:hypothetical protein
MASPAITASIFQEIQAFQHNRRLDVKDLAGALRSGNLDAAKLAFNDLASIGRNGPFKNAEPFSNSNRAQAFEAIGKALQTGDLAGAQAAFAALQSTFSHLRTASDGEHSSPAVIVNIGGGGGSTEAGGVSDTESIYQQLQDFRTARKTDLAELGTALQSGTTHGVQKAYDALVALGKAGPNRNGEVFQREDRAQAFEAIGAALKAGDLAGAQKAFADLAATFEHPFLPPTPPPVPATTPGSSPGSVPEIIINLGGGGSKGGATPEVVINVGSGGNPSFGTPEEIQINLDGSNGGLLAIDLAPIKGNRGGERITIDFNQPGGSKTELIVNLFNSGASNPAASSSLSLHA